MVSPFRWKGTNAQKNTAEFSTDTCSRGVHDYLTSHQSVMCNEISLQLRDGPKAVWAEIIMTIYIMCCLSGKTHSRTIGLWLTCVNADESCWSASFSLIEAPCASRIRAAASLAFCLSSKSPLLAAEAANRYRKCQAMLVLLLLNSVDSKKIYYPSKLCALCSRPALLVQKDAGWCCGWDLLCNGCSKASTLHSHPFEQAVNTILSMKQGGHTCGIGSVAILQLVDVIGRASSQFQQLPGCISQRRVFSTV